MKTSSSPSPSGDSPVRDRTACAGRYLYCIGDGAHELTLGGIGLDGSEVHTIAHKDVCAVVHDCPLEPYDSQDREIIKGWMLAHESVVETAWREFGTVLPFGFDTIIRGEDSTGAEKRLREWMGDEYGGLRSTMDELREKAEYVVQVSWDPRAAAGRVAELTMELEQAEREVASGSETKGAAYMRKQKIERTLKEEVESQAEETFEEFHKRIGKHADRAQAEKTKKPADGEMLMNLTCLVHDSKVKDLGRELDEIDKLQDFSVRFTGPWPPYSFVELRR